MLNNFYVPFFFFFFLLMWFQLLLLTQHNSTRSLRLHFAQECKEGGGGGADSAHAVFECL